MAARMRLTAEKTCWVQNVLNQAERGEPGSLDGSSIFGPLTRAAVMRVSNPAEVCKSMGS